MEKPKLIESVDDLEGLINNFQLQITQGRKHLKRLEKMKLEEKTIL